MDQSAESGISSSGAPAIEALLRRSGPGPRRIRSGSAVSARPTLCRWPKALRPRRDERCALCRHPQARTTELRGRRSVIGPRCPDSRSVGGPSRSVRSQPNGVGPQGGREYRSRSRSGGDSPEILLQDGLARRLAPAEMDHPDGEHSDQSRDPHWTDDGHRAHRDDVDGDHDHGAENNRDGVPDPPSTSAATLTMRYGGPGTPGGRRATPPR
jgi:hypothetical protein